jgi:hypothetical protein
LVLAILATVWVAVLLPPYLRSRRETSAHNTVRSFRSELGSLGRMAPEVPHLRAVPSLSSTSPTGLRSPLAPPVNVPITRARPTMSAEYMAKRRNDVLTVLAGVSIAIGVAAVVWPSTLTVALYFAGLAATGAYVYLVRQLAMPVVLAPAVRQRADRPSDDQLWEEFLEYRSAAR